MANIISNALDDLNEQELDELIAATRSFDPLYEAMSEAEIIAMFLGDLFSYPYWALAGLCSVEKILLQIVKAWGGCLSDIPEARRTRNLCQEAVACYGGALQYVPDPLRDMEMCVAAVSDYPPAMSHVPEPIRAMVTQRTQETS